MYLGLVAIDLIVATLLLPVWIVAALLVGHTATRATGRRVRRTARFALAFVLFGLLLVAARVGLFWGTASFGWVFVADRKIYTVAAILLPALAVPFALVRLRRQVRRVSRDEPVPAGARGALALPSVVLPVQLTAFAAVAGFNENFLSPDGGQTMKVLVFVGGLMLIAVLLLIRAQRRSERLALPGSRLRATGRIWLLRLGSTAVVVAVAMTLFTLGMNASKFPDSFSMMSGGPDYGGGEPIASGHAGGHHGSSVDTGAVSVTELRGPKAGQPDRRFTLTAQETQVRLSSGATVNALTYNGQAPGPELRVKKGDLVEVTLVNKLPSAPVTIHWHGVDVPNGEDGVAGVTQDAVRPGQSYTYRFKVDESGTRWYHSHQDGNEQVGRGLFGPMVIEDGQSTVDQDLSLVLHNWETDQGTRAAIGTADTLQHKQIAAGQKVRLRLVNSANTAKTISLTGVPYRVTALDGTAVNAPGELRDNQLVLGGSGRYDLEFTMPSTPVRLVDAEAPDAGMLFSNDGKGDLAPKLDGPEFDATTYGRPAPAPFNADSHYDRSFELKLDQQFGFYNGEFTARMTVNGKVFPDAPMQMVREGDLVRMKLINRGDEDHPIHLHGHHFLVLSKNGNRTTGSPMWLDTVNVRPGEIWEIGFRADNPGVWMDHCHNFRHAQLGMVFHLAYENVTTPFLVGGAAGNQPE